MGGDSGSGGRTGEGGGMIRAQVVRTIRGYEDARSAFTQT